MSKNLIEGKYYWVKLYEGTTDYEPAKCKSRVGHASLWFFFTDGSATEIYNVFDFKPLEYIPDIKTAGEMKVIFIIDGSTRSAEYTPMDLLNKSEQDILEDMEECTCILNESNSQCQGDCVKYENSSITGYLLSHPSSKLEESEEKITKLATDFIYSHFYPDIQAKGEGEESDNMKVSIKNWLTRKLKSGEIHFTPVRSEESQARIKELESVLHKIAKWETPPTGEFWDEEKTKPVGYETNYGSNGVRDYFKGLAQAVLFKDEQHLKEK